LREALRLDPGYARAWHWYGMMLMATARFPESLAAFDHAIALEPESGLYFAKRAGVLAAAGRAAEAEPALRTAIERFPQSGLAQRELGYLLVDTGRTEEGVAALRRAAELAGDEETNADLAWGYARAGRRAEAEAIAERLRERWEKSAASAAASPAPAASATPASTSASAAEFVSPLDLALVYAGLGHADDAFRWLDSALALRDPGLVYLATAPGFATLRGDARFAALLRAIGLDSREPRQEGTTSAAAAGAAEADPR
jgi:tetratricopeptide (TPR) repeat protein